MPGPADTGTRQTDAYLGVEKSLTGKRWIMNGVDERTALTIAQRLQVPEIVGRLLAIRGIELETAGDFLDPTLKALLPDPGHLKGMEEAAERLAGAIMQDELIAVFGDYDVDGATSSALLNRFISAAGGRCRVYIPDRLKEGYGPNTPALMLLKEEGASVVVTVDCGTNAFEPLTAARQAGLDVIVVDHHEAEATLPPSIAVINPNRLDEDSPHGQLAAVGVAFLLVVALNRALRRAAWYGERPEPDLLQWLDLVALGTVCDVVPLIGVNRALVRQGLKVMAGRANTGLKALSDVAGIDEAPGTYHAGFILGPRINAGGRVGAADLGSRLLASDDVDEAMTIAHKLNELNRERQEIEAAVLADAVDRVESTDLDKAPAILIDGEGWHPGVIGIVASRLKDRYNRPACVIAMDGGKGVGSGRSVKGVDLGAAVIAARQAGLLLGGGGHTMAAGFTVASEQLAGFRDFLSTRIGQQIETAAIVPSLYLDAPINPGAATMGLLDALQAVGPFGSGNPEPRFVIANARLDYADQAGENHVRCTIASDGGKPLKGIAFRALDSDLGPALLKSGGAPLHITGRLRVNHWRGYKTPQIQIDDAAEVW
ncbi:MAG: single-stranded-DNA-specific exonuclease RecJ [Rhodospirillales bacterium]|nr:single-stranded-DNA-specific exonuclease RecJ [Rhodospirillales bacterium]